MENPEFVNSSTKLDKKKKSKLFSDKNGASSEQETVSHGESNIRPKRSFWKNLFRKHPKRSEVPEMRTDQNAALVNSVKLNAIFEEPKNPEEKERVAEFEEIKKTLKKVSTRQPTSVFLASLTTSPLVKTRALIRDEAVIDYLSDVSSSSYESLGPNEKTQLIDNEPYADLKKPLLTEQRDSPTGRDAYSFEYSESSDISAEEVMHDAKDKIAFEETKGKLKLEETKDKLKLEENKDKVAYDEFKDKVTFDETVIQKDVDSNIVLRELNNEEHTMERLEEDEELETNLSDADEEEQATSELMAIVGYSRREAMKASPFTVAEQMGNNATTLTTRQRKLEEFLSSSPLGSIKSGSNRSFSNIPEVMATVFTIDRSAEPEPEKQIKEEEILSCSLSGSIQNDSNKSFSSIPEVMATVYTIDRPAEPEPEIPAEESKSKVTFDEKVKQKDTDSNIVMSDLTKAVEEDDADARALQEEEEFQRSLVELDKDQEVSEMVGIVGYSKREALMAARTPEAQPYSTAYFTEQHNNTAPQMKRYQDILAISGASTAAQTEGLNSCVSMESIEESELWSQKLNELSGLTKSVLPTVVDVNSLDDSEAGYREYRLDDFFKMIFRQTSADQTINYSVAYDPIFANFTIQCEQPQPEPPLLLKPPGDEKQKVVRKRKMMSLLHDKSKMAQYIKEIEQQQEEFINCASIIAAPQNSPSHASLERKASNISKKHISLCNVCNKEDEQILFVLENTKEKLQKWYMEKNPTICPKVLSLYPDNYLETFNLNPQTEVTNNEHSPNISSKVDLITSTELSTTANQKQFKNFEQEIENIFQELIVNVSELKDMCMVNGAMHDEREQPLIINEDTSQIVQTVLDEILDKVFEMNDHHNDTRATISIQSAPALSKTFIPPEMTLERSEEILTALKDEFVEYNTVSYLEDQHLREFEETFKDLLQISPNPSDSQFIPRNFIHLLNDSNPTDSSLQPTELKSDPVNYTNPESDPVSEPVRQMAENLVENITQSVETTRETIPTKDLEKSKRFGPLYDRKPGESQEQLDTEKIPQKKKVYKNFRTTDPPEVTDSLQHIFFGENSGEIIQSEFNLIEDNCPRAGPSKDLDNMSLPHLPSVPSTDLYTENHSDSGNLQTIVDNRFSAHTGSSIQLDIPLDLVNIGQNMSACSSSNPKANLQLERKSPEINLTDSTGFNLNKDDFEKTFADHMQAIQQSMLKIDKVSQKTVELLTSSTFSTPEGSISILSTIAENLLESQQGSRSSSQDRYPQFLVSQTNSQNVPLTVPKSEEEEIEKTDS